MSQNSRTFCGREGIAYYVTVFVCLLFLSVFNVGLITLQKSAASTGRDEDIGAIDQDDVEAETPSGVGSSTPSEADIPETNVAPPPPPPPPPDASSPSEPEPQTSTPTQPEPDIIASTPTEPELAPEPQKSTPTDLQPRGNEGITASQSSLGTPIPPVQRPSDGQIFQSTVDSFQVLLPPGYFVEDIDNANASVQMSERQNGYAYLATICRLDDAITDSGRYQCDEQSTANVNLMRFTGLYQSPEFASLGNRNITTSDLLSYYLQFREGTGVIRDITILNNTDTTVNIVDARTNQVEATAPAKLLDYTYSYTLDGITPLDGITQMQGSESSLLVLDGATAYILYHDDSPASVPSGTVSPPVEQIFDSFNILQSARAG